MPELIGEVFHRSWTFIELFMDSYDRLLWRKFIIFVLSYCDYYEEFGKTASLKLNRELIKEIIVVTKLVL